MRRWALFLVLAAFLNTGAGHLGAQEADLSDVGFVLGDPAAPVTVVEYADFACGACGQFARDAWPVILREYVETGRVRWRMVPFELGFRNSERGARAGQCAARQEQFWVMHDALYERQEAWVNERRARDIIQGIAVEVGLDMEAFRRCVEDDHGEDDRDAANQAARNDGIRATPTFFINGFRVQGALPMEAFRALLVPPSGG